MSRLRWRRRETGAFAAVSGRFGRNVDGALDEIERVIVRARARGARLVVFPECALGGYPTEALPYATREPGEPSALSGDGPEIARLVRHAGPTVVCAGYTEDASGGPYSSAVCVSGDGVLGRHRKVHIPPAEAPFYRAGEGFSAFDTPVGRLGMLTCYDKVFPEGARALALDGAEVVASMAAWPACRTNPARRLASDLQTRHFDLLDRARAVENQVVWVSANQSRRLGRLRFIGRAKVVDPNGEVLATTGDRPGVALASVRPDAVTRAREAISHLGDRNPVAYALDSPGWQALPTAPAMR